MPFTVTWDAGFCSPYPFEAFPELPFEPRAQFGTIMVDEALCFQNSYALYASGQLEESTYQAYLR